MMKVTGEIQTQTGDPTTIKGALSKPDEDEWHEVMEEHCTVFGRREDARMKNPRQA